MIALVVAGLLALIATSCGKIETTPDSTDPQTDAPAMNRMPNMGGGNTTDFIDSDGDGRADGVATNNRITQFGILSGPRCQWAQSVSQFVMISPAPAPKSSPYNTLTFRYRSTTPFMVVARYGAACGNLIYTGGVEHEWRTVTIENFWCPNVRCIMWYNRANEPGQVDVDEVNLY